MGIGFETQTPRQNRDGKYIKYNQIDTVLTCNTSVSQGYMLQEVRQVFNNFTSQVIRLRINERHAEFEFTVGPIPVA